MARWNYTGPIGTGPLSDEEVQRMRTETIRNILEKGGIGFRTNAEQDYILWAVKNAPDDYSAALGAAGSAPKEKPSREQKVETARKEFRAAAPVAAAMIRAGRPGDASIKAAAKSGATLLAEAARRTAPYAEFLTGIPMSRESLAFAAIPGGMGLPGGVARRLGMRAGKKIFEAVPRRLPKVTAKQLPEDPLLRRLGSVEDRLQRGGLQTKRIIQMFKEADTVSRINAGKATEILHDAKFFKLSGADRFKVGLALRGKLNVQALSSEARTAFDAADSYIKAIPARARAAKLEVMTSRGKAFPFPNKPHYFPQPAPSVSKLAKGKIRKDVLKNVVAEGRFESPEEAKRALDSWVSIVKKRGIGSNDYYAEKLVASGQAKTLAEAKGQILLYYQRSRLGRYGPLERAREKDFPFYDPDPRRVIPRYVEGAEKRLAEAKVMGPKLQRVSRQLGKITDQSAREEARYLVKVARQATESEDPQNIGLLRLGRKTSTLLLSPLTAITNLGQTQNALLQGDVKSFISGLRASLGSGSKALARESGAVAFLTPHDIERATGGLKSYLRAIGFTQGEIGNRIRSANVGVRYAERQTAALLADPKSKSGRFAARELNFLEMNPENVLRHGGLTHDDRLRAAKVFTEKTQFLSRTIDLPPSSTASELGRTIWQLRTFAYQQGKLITRETIGRIRAGDYARGFRNIAILSTIYPLTGEAIADLRALAQGKKREARGFRRWVENSTYSGTFSLLSDAASGIKYGNLAETVLGPTFGRALRNIMIGAKIAQGKAGAQEAREIVRQVPAAGPIISNRLFPRKQKKQAIQSVPPERRTTRRSQRGYP